MIDVTKAIGAVAASVAALGGSYTLGGLLISGLPKLLEYFQNKADK